MNLNNVNIGETISLVLMIKGRIPTGQQWKVLGKCGYDIAKTISDVDGVHAANLSYLSVDTPKSASLLDYILLEGVGDLQRTAIATAWVEEFTRHDTSDYTLELTSLDTQEFQDLEKVLKNYGYSGRYKLVAR